MYKKVPNFKKELRKQLKRIKKETWATYKHTRKIMKKGLANVNYEAMNELYSQDMYCRTFAEYWNYVANGLAEANSSLKKSEIRVTLSNDGNKNNIMITVIEK